ncbi:hypothetical protein Ahy_A05g023870 isoform A [Arachis hypogaea]|uniref:Band 7 domain-containing protein n=1 Tax=Arachis hypogaea TaxID=3818 RepID=A0A445D4Q6_ARAHY|nr:hypothetical protein Ahy_A05g023870 isoform A [Arachis hypogaea]
MGNTFCFFCGCIQQSNVGVVEKWGRFSRLAQPGFHFFNPLAGECLAGLLSTRICSLDVRVETKTKDNVFVQLLCSIQYRVVKENADDAFYELQNPQEQIQAYVFDVTRAIVPRMNLDELFEQKDHVAKAVLEELAKVMGDYGYSIEHILMVDIIPDPSVRKAMNEINAAQRMQLASVYKGEAEKVLQVKKAEAEAESKYLGGVGVARQRQAITDGLRENILNFSHKVEGASPKEVMDLIMITQYFDTIKDLGNSSKNTTVFIPHGPGHVRDIGDQIRNGLMEASSAQSTQTLKFFTMRIGVPGAVFINPKAIANFSLCIDRAVSLSSSSSISSRSSPNSGTYPAIFNLILQAFSSAPQIATSGAIGIPDIISSASFRRPARLSRSTMHP